MSGEGTVQDGQFYLVDPAVDPDMPDIPRALFPWHAAVRPEMGLEIVRSVDETAHRHMMEAFYQTPRAQLFRIPDSLAIQLHVPLSESWSLMALDVDDPENLHIVPIGGDPDLRGRVVTAREVFRRPRVWSFQAWDVLSPSLDRMLVCYDHRGDAIGSIPLKQEEGERGELPKILPHIDALRAIGAPVFRHRTNTELAHLFSLADTFLGPKSTYARKTKNLASIERHFVFENALHAIELLDRFRKDNRTLRFLYRICSSPATESLLDFCESPEEIKHIAKLIGKFPPWFMGLCRAYSTLCHDTISAGDQTKLLYERPLESHVYQLGFDLIKTMLFHHGDPDFREDYLNASMQALSDTLNALHNISLPDVLPKEQSMYKGLADFASMHGGEAVAMSLIAPIVERYFFLKLQRIIPGEFEKARQFFYKAIGSALNAHSNEATGDDKLQLSLLVDVFKELTRLGYWKKGGILQDAGSGDGLRILKPFLDSRVMQEASPGTVYAVDADAYPQPDHGKWIAVQGKFEDPDYAMIHAQHLGQEHIVPIDAITESWSSPNDLEAPKQQEMFANFARSLRKREGNKPGGILVLELPMGYIEAMIQYAEDHGLREMGRAPLYYPVGEGMTLEKPLEIMLAHNVLIRAMRAGFRPLNLPPGKGEIKTPAFYRTGAGKDRAIFVFERVGDPQMTLEQAALAEGHMFVGSGRPDRPA